MKDNKFEILITEIQTKPYCLNHFCHICGNNISFYDISIGELINIRQKTLKIDYISIKIICFSESN
jgi:hypothetical protein